MKKFNVVVTSGGVTNTVMAVVGPFDMEFQAHDWVDQRKWSTDNLGYDFVIEPIQDVTHFWTTPRDKPNF